MPNWIYNTMHFDTAEAFRAFCKAYCKEEEEGLTFSFASVVAEPETEAECREKYGEKYILSADGKSQDGLKLGRVKGKEWFNWYDWQMDFWGVKWDASNSFVNKEKRQIGFETPWGAPVKLYETLASQGWQFRFIADCEGDMWRSEGHADENGVFIDNEEQEDDFSDDEDEVQK